MSSSLLVTTEEFEQLQKIRKTNERKNRVNPSSIEFMLDLIDTIQERASNDEPSTQIIRRLSKS